MKDKKVPKLENIDRIKLMLSNVFADQMKKKISAKTKLNLKKSFATEDLKTFPT